MRTNNSVILALTFTIMSAGVTMALDYVVVETGLETCFDNFVEIPCPAEGEPFYGQDAQYQGIPFAYQDNNDGTITDHNTDLMWQKTPNLGNKLTWNEAFDYADTLTVGGHADWRLPTIKELLSLADFTGNINTMTPYIDTNYFDFEYPDTTDGDRIIDAQYVSSTQYVETIFHGDEGFFGFNFADGRLKCYPILNGPNGVPRWYVRCLRGREDYSINSFVDNGDGTISDLATGLMWQKSDDGEARNWEDALSYSANLELAGYDDWRLPDAKQLQSIVDYSRPAPAIDTVFGTMDDEGWFWSSTTFYEHPRDAMYVAFGRAVNYRGIDVHGAGALRSDPKSGDPDEYPFGRGPQHDEVRIYNYVRCVRSEGATNIGDDRSSIQRPDQISISQNYPNPFNANTIIRYSIPSASAVAIDIYDILGYKVETLIQAKQQAGYHQIVWNADLVPSGMYFYRIKAGGYTETRKMVVLK